MKYVSRTKCYYCTGYKVDASTKSYVFFLIYLEPLDIFRYNKMDRQWCNLVRVLVHLA